MVQRSYGGRTVSPNQEFRREEILEAAVELLRSRGVAACTVRGIAERAGVSKGVIHYYFADAQELVELAFARLSTAYYAHVREQAEAVGDPERALWHAIIAYVAPWNVHSSMSLLWCEYYVAAARAGRLDGVVAAQRAMREMFAGLLARVSPQARRHASALTRYITGTVLTQQQMPVTLADLLAEAARLVGMPEPASVEPACTDAHCRFHVSRPTSKERTA